MTTKIAVITGASRGLGRSMAIHLAREGVGVVGTYQSRKDAADAVVAEIEAAGGKAAMLPLDAGASADFGRFGSELARALDGVFGRTDFDFLVNNAGVAVHAGVMETTEAQFDELFRIHLKAPYFLSQALLPMMADGGRILNVSSGLARFTTPGYSAYAAMKGGVEVMTRYMAKELGRRRITVNTVAPGAIETDFGGGAVRDNPELNRMIASTIPLGRAGKPDDIGAAVASLLSDALGWMNGERIEVSGGQNV